MRFIVLAPPFLLSANCFAQSEMPAKYQWEAGVYGGTLLLSKIPEVIDNVSPVLLKLSNRSSLGILEASVMSARGNGMVWRSALLDYRFDLDDLYLPFHALFGFQIDSYQKYEGQKNFYGGGWHYGGGAHLEIVPGLNVRADFLNRYGPGRSLLVVLGLSFGFGGAESSAN